MSQTNTDTVVLSALAWLERQIAEQGHCDEGDCAILIHKMIEQHPLTISQYWQVANAGLSLTGKNSHTTWMLSQVWQKLSDWSPAGKTLIGLVELAEESGFCMRVDRSTDKTVRELRKRASNLSPKVSWDKQSFSKWLSHRDTTLTCWTAESILGLHAELHAELLAAYLWADPDPESIKPIETHSNLSLDALTVLLESKNWPVSLLQERIERHMSCFNMHCPPQTAITLGAWFDTLEWTKENAAAHLGALTGIIGLHGSDSPTWRQLLPRVGSLLADILTNEPGLDSDLPLFDQIETATDIDTAAAIYAATPVCLPSAMTEMACENESLLALMGNNSYSFDERLAWMVEYKDKIIPEGNLAMRLEAMPSPVREGVALWCILQAQRIDPKTIQWYKSGVSAEQAGGKRFLNKHAPALATTLAAANTLDLDFPVALEMFLSSHPYRGVEPVAVLPDLS
jgi:hypothetical protein